MIALLGARATLLLAALVLSLALGWLVDRLLNLQALVGLAASLAAWFGRKLNRAKRDTATRAWRGVIVLLALLLPAILLALWIAQRGGQLANIAALMAVFITALQPRAMIALGRQARAGMLTLQSEHPHFLFADTHALLRFRILDHSRAFAVGVVGVSFWYWLLGLAGAAAYLALALAAAQFTATRTETRVFGSVARELFAGADALPRRLAALLLWLAAWFVPGTRPVAALSARNDWPLFLALLLHISLGGPMPGRPQSQPMEWVGDGTARLEAADLRRWLLVWALALVWLALVAVPGAFYINLLK